MVNKVILIGNVGADPDVKYLEGGTAVANIRLATTESYKNKNGEKVEQTEWHTIVLWRGLAEIVEKYVRKGMRLYIERRLRTRTWDDQNGAKRYTTEIWADNMQMLSFKQDGDNAANPGRTYNAPASSAPASSSGSAAPAMGAPDDNDDLPF